MRPLSTLVAEGQLTPEAVSCLKTALPQSGSAISRLVKRDGRNNPKQADHGGRKLDAQLLKELHDHATAGVFNQSTLTDGLTLLTPGGLSEISDLTSRCATDQRPADLPPGPLRLLEPDYRDTMPVNFELNPGSNLSRNGLHEMPGSQNNDEFRLFIPVPGRGEPPRSATAAAEWSRQEVITLVARDGTRRELMARAQKIIDRNARLIRVAPSEDFKLSAIARCCQDLERAHLFADEMRAR
ncbi:hypothetical protein [Xanthomonas graminis]|uniref:hypothetical protein n=1 Tax=Xanthomonas graminis TaxID=3390026 RepID=UPI001F15CFD6|nr:hypothetical protein [Xanthomonas translucens]UKE72265.1 hypothetical protein KFS85_14515 [Xanthomonas translucens pv. phleipratensis]